MTHSIQQARKGRGRQEVAASIGAALACFALTVAVAACTGPSAPSVPVPDPPVTRTFDLHIEGQAIDESAQPVSGAVVRIVEIHGPCCDGEFRPGTGATTDEHGSFGFTATLPEGAREVLLEITRNGYEPARVYVDQIPSNRVTLYRTLTIAAGESIDTQILLNYYQCGWEGTRCRRVVIETTPGASAELELTPLEAQEDVGLLDEEPSVTSVPFERRITVSDGEAFIVGGPARVRLTAR